MKHQYGKKIKKYFWYYWNKVCKFLFTPRTRWVKNTIFIYNEKKRRYNRATVETGLNRKERRMKSKNALGQFI